MKLNMINTPDLIYTTDTVIGKLLIEQYIPMDITFWYNKLIITKR